MKRRAFSRGCPVTVVTALATSALACSNNQTGAPSDAGADTQSAPYLVSLAVTATSKGAASPPIQLVPSFSSDIHDYYVRCAQGTNALTVSMQASEGAKSSLAQPKTTRSSPQQTVSLMVNENQAIVAVATRGSASIEYWVRCLPYDFPQMKMVLHPEVGSPPPGYYLIGTARPTNSGYAIVLNTNGVPVWYYNGGTVGVADVDSIIPGSISFFLKPGAPAAAVQLSPFKTTYVAPSDAGIFDPHELQALPNGNFLGLSNPVATADLTGLEVPLPDGGTDSPGPDSTMALCNIVEFDPSGHVVWTWVGADHLDPVQDSTAPDLVFFGNGVVAIDPYHCNSIDIDPINGPGNLLVSSRNMDSVFYIERSTSKILWKMGGSTYTKEGAPYVKVDSPFRRQHDARLQPGWSLCSGGRGQISLYDDESLTSNSARGVVYDVVVGAGGSSGSDCGTGDTGAPGAKVLWEYLNLGSSFDRGSFRILADGSRVIGWGNVARPPIVFTEVDEAGHDLLDFYFTGYDVSYRAIKVPFSAFDLDVLRKTAGATTATP